MKTLCLYIPATERIATVADVHEIFRCAHGHDVYPRHIFDCQAPESEPLRPARLFFRPSASAGLQAQGGFFPTDS
ncbi:hypothetical protein R0K04_27775, partial [Pseudoalteromonas sp. SIMBA_153]